MRIDPIQLTQLGRDKLQEVLSSGRPLQYHLLRDHRFFNYIWDYNSFLASLRIHSILSEILSGAAIETSIPSNPSYPEWGYLSDDLESSTLRAFKNLAEIILDLQDKIEELEDKVERLEYRTSD